MILPIVGFGNPVLRKETTEVDSSYDNLESLIDNMFETMYNANGVGLAAPQIGLAIRLFVVDSAQMFEDATEEEADGEVGIKQVFINPKVVSKTGEPWPYSEGCLSIPGIREDVEREETIVIKYLDRDFKEHEETFDKITARVILHEYDHIEGVLFTDHLSNLRKRLLKRKLEKITKGNVDVDYRMTFYKAKKGRK